MANTYLLSDPSKRYLCCYYQILDEMIQGITTAKLSNSNSSSATVEGLGFAIPIDDVVVFFFS